MAVNNNFSDMNIDYECQLGVAQTSVECVIDTSSKGGVGKLLSVSGDVSIKNIETSEGEAKINAIFNSKVISVNIEGSLCSYDYFTEFSCIIKSEKITVGMINFANGCVVDIDSAISGVNIKLQAVIDIELRGVVAKNFKCLTELGEEIFAKKEMQTVQQLLGKVDECFNIVEEYETGVNVEKILLFDYCAILTSIKPKADIIAIGGDICATIVYECAGMITTKNFNLPFNEEIDAKGCLEDAKANLTVNIKDGKIVLAGVEGDNILRLELECEVCGLIFTHKDVEVIEDVCSPNFSLEYKECEKEFNAYETTSYFSDKISGSAELGDNFVGVRRVIATSSGRNCVSNLYALDGKIVVEGVLACNVIYEDSNMEINSVMVEIPYSLPFVCNHAGEDDALSAQVCAEVLGAKVKRDKEIDVMANICIAVAISKEMEFECICELTVGEQCENKLSALTIYQSRSGETLWDVAKNICAPIEKITAQNPSLSDGTVRGQKIIYFRQLTM